VRRASIGGLAALALAALALALAAGAQAATHNVAIRDFEFSPQNLTILPGDTVVWTNLGPSGHDVSFEAGFGSGAPGAMAVNSTFSYTFNASGVYKYRCALHAPGGFDPPNVMIGRITVAAPVSSPANHTITIEGLDLRFVPDRLEVATGDTVTFVNNAQFAHDVNFSAGFGSGGPGSLAAGESWSYTFNAAGTFDFVCELHAGAGMNGSIAVFDRVLRPAVSLSAAIVTRVTPGTAVSASGTAEDALSNITGVFLRVDGGAPIPLNFSATTPGDGTSVSWSASFPPLSAGTHTYSIYSTNGAHDSTAIAGQIVVAAATTGTGTPSGNPFGTSFVFEDILTNYFWLITGISVILLAVVMMFLSYSGKLQNYYIVLLTALDERHRFFAFARPTREFLYTIQRQMPRTHTERYNLKVIWYWYPLYCLGGLSFAAFIIETITGIILGFYYIPEGTGPNEGLPSAAYHSMETIMTKVTFGYIFRALHHWGAHMMVAAVFLHMMRVYFVGAYKNPRELNWLLGVILLNVVILFGYTGYLLPWDQLSFWAGQIGLEMAYTIPVVGEIIGNMLFGGPELSGATIIRMYYLHVFVLPLVGGALMVLHMGIVWMQGVAEPH
jgi:plastocyanin